MTPSLDADPPFVDVKLLRLFDLLYSNGSVTQTAEMLGQSQPTISIWLRRLREQLNDPLFLRTPSGMRPTPRADDLIAPCREALDAIKRVSAAEPEFDPRTADRAFRLCMTDASHVTMLPRLLARIRKSAPAVKLVALRPDAEPAAQLESGEAALALGLFNELESGFYQQTLFWQDWVCLVSKRHPRIFETLDAESYFKEAHVGLTAGSGGRVLELNLKRLQAKRRVLLELPGVLGLGPLVAQSDLVVTLPRMIGEIIAKPANLVVLPCPLDLPSFAVKQYWHARFHREPANRWLRGLCSQLYRGLAMDGSASASSLRP